MQKSTEMLINEIKTTDRIESFISENTEEIQELSLSEYLRKLLQKYNLEKSDVFKRAGMADTNYGYELFRNDVKKASRDKLIRICIGFPLSVEEAQKVLRYGKVRPLYPRDERDAYILFGLNKRYTLDELNDLLYEHNLEIFE
jgi:hypothetical protein